jgi:hypothetical protein
VFGSRSSERTGRQAWCFSPCGVHVCMHAVCTVVRSFAGQHYVPTMAEVGLVFFATRDALVVGTIFWALYMAFEPYARRRWAADVDLLESVIAWPFMRSSGGAVLLAGCVLGTVALCVVRPLVSPFNTSIAPQPMSKPGG